MAKMKGDETTVADLVAVFLREPGYREAVVYQHDGSPVYGLEFLREDPGDKMRVTGIRLGVKPDE